MKFKVVLILFFLIAASPALANSFKTYESGPCIFNLYDYELKPQFERAIVFGVSVIIDSYKDTFKFPYKDGFKVKVTIFGNKDKFLEYQKKQTGSIISESGYFAPQYNETVVVINKNAKKPLKETKRMIGVVFHETSHLVLSPHVPWCPLWLNEGLAEYFEGMNVFGEKRRIYIQKWRIKWCKHWAKKGFPITLKEYVGLDYKQWMAFRGKDQNAAYTIGYSLIYFLMSRKSTETVLKELLWDFKRQGREANSLQVIDNCYPGGFKKLERMWLKWIPKARKSRPLRALKKATNKNPPPTK